MNKFEEKKQIKCSFCGKQQEQVRRIIAGPGVYICDECIGLCQEIIEEDFIINGRRVPAQQPLERPGNGGAAARQHEAGAGQKDHSRGSLQPL